MHNSRQQLTDIRGIVRHRWVAGLLGSGPVLAMLVGLLGLWQAARAADFSCPGGDVTCLIDAITQANANGEANTITLDAGTYTLTAVNNDTDGPNGLPSVTGIVTIQGAGVDTTILERDASAPNFRLCTWRQPARSPWRG
jgi:hypothetical protein